MGLGMFRDVVHEKGQVQWGKRKEVEPEAHVEESLTSVEESHAVVGSVFFVILNMTLPF